MPSTELLQGTLDLLILKALALGPNHGVGVARRVQQVTNGTFDTLSLHDALPIYRKSVV